MSASARGALPYPGPVTETPVRTRPAGLLYAQAAEYQDRLEALERVSTEQVRAAWVTAEDAILDDLDALLAKMDQARATGQRVSPAWAFQEARYRAMLETTTEQVELFSRTAESVAYNAQRQAALQATTAAPSLVSAAAAEVGLSQAFDAIQPANVETLAGFLQDGSPLHDLFTGIGPAAAAQARDTLTAGIVLGRGNDRIRRDMLQTIQMPRHRAETIVRTETHRVFRETSRRTYAANQDVVTGWTWLAGLGPRCCPGCVRMHGTTHPVTETLDGHPRCRCVMVPRVPDQDLAIQPGLDWLKDQPERTQRAILGPGKFTAWRDGRLDLEDLVTRTEDPRWGTMRREATLTEALAAKGRRAPATRRPAVTDPSAMTSADLDRLLAANGGPDTIQGLKATEGGTSGETFTGTLKDGTAVVVRNVAERDRAKVDAEELSHALAERLGANVPALVRTGPTQTVAIRLRGDVVAEDGVAFTDAEAALFARAVAAHPDQARRLALLDDLTYHPDRHLGNVFVDEHGDLFGIDQANRMPRTARGFRPKEGEFTDLLADAPQTVAELDLERAALEGVRELAERLGLVKEWAAMSERLAVQRARAAGS